MERWKGVASFDLKTERNIENSFIVEFDSDWDWPSDDDPYPGYHILIDADILFKENAEYEIFLEISSEKEVLFSDNIDLLKPVSKSSDYVRRTENGIRYSLTKGLYGIIDLEFDAKYYVKIKSQLDYNQIEVNWLYITISKRVL